MRLFIFIFLLCGNTLTAQIIPFNGKVLDQATNEPVQYAHLLFIDLGGGAATSEAGEFSIVLEEKYLTSKVKISCLNYQDTLVDAKELLEGNFYLKPSAILLPEIMFSVSSKVKEIKLGSIKGKKKEVLSKRNIAMVAQLIKFDEADKSCIYLKRVKITFKNNWFNPAIARLRILDTDPLNGFPDKDLLRKEVFVNIDRGSKVQYFDLSEYDIRVPEEGFFVALEKLIIPVNRTFTAPIHLSTYPKYVKAHKTAKREAKDNQEISNLLSFEKYRDEVSHYAPTFDIVKKNAKQKHFGNLYFLNSDEWEVYSKEDVEYIMPIEVTLSN